MIHDVEQGSADWLALRRGIPTASDFSRIITPTGKQSDQWHGLMCNLIAECCIEDANSFTGSRWTERGHELEPEAREVYRDRFNVFDWQQVGFVTLEDEHGCRIAGCSPDDAIVRDGQVLDGLEIKCPNAEDHVATVAAGKVPQKYLPQIHASMLICGAPQWHFMSYCRGMEPFVCHVAADPAYGVTLARLLRVFHLQYQQMYQRLISKLSAAYKPDVDLPEVEYV